MNNKKDIYGSYENDGTTRFYFIGILDGPNRIVEVQRVLETGKSEWGYINHLTPAYKSRELLIENIKILSDPCIECGGVIKASYTNGYELKERQMCFSCSLWYDRMHEQHLENKMIVNHMWYSIAKDTKSGFRGFGGAVMRFIKNETIIQSSNVWFGGDIPKHFHDRIPDNAKFVKNDNI